MPMIKHLIRIVLDQNMVQAALIDYARKCLPSEERDISMYDITWSAQGPWNYTLQFQEEKPVK